jgi:uncharacterized integral membrane protein
MNILRWVLFAALAMAFLLLSVANWTPVPFRLPDGVMINPPLPILLGIAFIAGWLPTWLIHIGAKVSWKRKLGKLQQGDDGRAPGISKLPSQAQPTIVPPAGA